MLVEYLLSLSSRCEPLVFVRDTCSIVCRFVLERLFEFTCEWNYRPDHCIYENNCLTAVEHGIRIVHGCRRAFHNDRYEEFKSIYEVIQRWPFDGNDLRMSLVKQIEVNLEKFASSNCGQVSSLFTKHLSREISSLAYASFKQRFHLALFIGNDWTSVDQSYVLLKSLRTFAANQIDRIHLHVLVRDVRAQIYFSAQVKSHVRTTCPSSEQRQLV
jgi:hypothetical protein